MRLLAVGLVAGSLAAQSLGVHEILSRPILAPDQATVEVQAYTASRVPALRIPETLDQWKRSAADIRRRVLEDVVFRGEARKWRSAKTRVERLDTLPGGDGYSIKKLRYEAIPGLWIPALLYEPDDLSGKVPIIIHVNGHDRPLGKAVDYKQTRAINVAKRGMLSLNLEWMGMGQLDTPGFSHRKINQLDLLGTSGVALHYLAMTRAIDLMLEHPNADPERVGVTGLSGGGWQTIFLSALDERVALSNPVAGYSSFVTRAQFPRPDLGDSEQTPSDLATVADYTHLTALLAPRPALITNNARDTCCFRAAYAQPPLLQAARPIYALYDRPDRLRNHINQDPGHNYGRDNREQFYRLVRDFFFRGELDAEELNVESELLTRDELDVDLPDNNLDFRQIALALAKNQPSQRSGGRDELRKLTRTPRYTVAADSPGDALWRLRMGADWTVPAVEIAPDNPRGTVLVVADGGRQSAAGDVRAIVASGRRAIALDPFYFGESNPQPKDWIFAMMIATVGDRPLGVQAGQIASAARWARERYQAPVEIHAIGPRLSLAALIAAALETEAIASLRLEESFRSLHEIFEADLDAENAPELFCFGLLEAFDIDDIVELVSPRPVEFR